MRGLGWAVQAGSTARRRPGHSGSPSCTQASRHAVRTSGDSVHTGFPSRHPQEETQAPGHRPPWWGHPRPPHPPQRRGPFIPSTRPRSAACLELSTHPPVPRSPSTACHPRGGPDAPGHLVLPKSPLCASLCPIVHRKLPGTMTRTQTGRRGLAGRAPPKCTPRGELQGPCCFLRGAWGLWMRPEGPPPGRLPAPDPLQVCRRKPLSGERTRRGPLCMRRPQDAGWPQNALELSQRATPQRGHSDTQALPISQGQHPPGSVSVPPHSAGVYPTQPNCVDSTCAPGWRETTYAPRPSATSVTSHRCHCVGGEAVSHKFQACLFYFRGKRRWKWVRDSAHPQVALALWWFLDTNSSRERTGDAPSRLCARSWVAAGRRTGCAPPRRTHSSVRPCSRCDRVALPIAPSAGSL